MHSSRRRKKRLNYGVRTVEVERGPNGFGFTISGQQPCILSCIVAHSPADIAGLRAGDFLISVNGISVSKLAHDAVVNLIGNCFGPIQMTIAENYYSDSSDDDVDVGRIVNVRKVKHGHKSKGHKIYQKSFDVGCKRNALKTRENTKNGNNYDDYLNTPSVSYQMLKENATGPIEYKAIVGYLGTIEMPKQLLPNSRLSTVVSCIRKLRQEKRVPTAVLMTILPTCLTLKNASNHILAIYPTNRVVYINSPTDKDSRYFGLVTSAINDANDNTESDKKSDVNISNSCHVFVTDTKIAEHETHAKKAESFQISCTIDVVTGSCLEFPQNALYLVKLIQNMFRLEDIETDNKNNEELVANSPQPSASSNSDSGIGYRDECGNISDRILVVEFPSQRPSPILPIGTKRPANVTLQPNLENFSLNNNSNINNIRACENKGEKQDVDTIYNRLTVRAMPLNFNSNNIKVNEKNVTDNFIPITDDDSFSEKNLEIQEIILPSKSETTSLPSIADDVDFRSSVDNISVYSSKSIELSNLKAIFKTPNSNKFFEYKKARKLTKPMISCDNLDKCNNDTLLNYKLSPKVYGVSKPTQSCEELNSPCDVEKHCFGSLQDLSSWYVKNNDNRNVTQSYPDVRVEKNLHSNSNLRNELNSEGPASWTTSFEKLLECSIGLHTFAEFLKKEFSAENIYFWTACERFKLMPPGVEKRKEAAKIYERHLCIGSTDAVNVDSQARSIAEHCLEEAGNKTFELAQKQIFNLMKFDSYPRFLKSDLYKQSLSGSIDCPELDTRLLIQPPPSVTPSKLKKSLSNAEDRRRKSLLPWHKKNRSKSKDRGDIDWAEKNKNDNTEIGIQTPMDLKLSSQLLTGCEVFVERKVTFKLDLPNKKIISVKSKHTKIIGDVLKQLLQRYGYLLSDVDIANGEEIINLDLAVTTIENCRLTVSLKQSRPTSTSNAVKLTVLENAKMLDEITNKVYKDILQEKTECVNTKSDRSSVKSEDWGSDHSSSIIGRFLRRDSALLDRKKKFLTRCKMGSTNNSNEDVNNELSHNNHIIKKPLIAKWKSGPRLQTACSESDELYEGLSRAQRSRLEDQRGTEINYELPDFLKDKENSSNHKQSLSCQEKQIENSKFYTSTCLDVRAIKYPRNNQEYENHTIYSPESKSSPTFSTSEDSSTSNQSSPTKNKLDVTVIERNPYTNKVNEPPPLPPKPKIVPIKPSNWGQGDYNHKKDAIVRKIVERKDELFLEQPTSSFV
ncbi:regulator of G-protein signaling loco isoform X2 [Onthophagus taurus]|uniref:regulator of G-protein signaling loco isoform X2 n=1 Tax=Onthophagus taurus TaxID=166361 RepID=UPI0039BEC1F0